MKEDRTLYQLLNLSAASITQYSEYSDNSSLLNEISVQFWTAV